MSNSRKKNLFTTTPVMKVSRNLFDLSHEVKMSGKFGYLYPVLCVETLPGDTFRDKMNCLLRFAPLAAPVMHRCDVTTHFFFVPNRIIWDNWQLFITGGRDGTEAPVPPYYTPAGIALNGDPEFMKIGSLWDYLGLPTAPTVDPGVFSAEHVSALPFYAVAKVWNDYYRDPNLLAWGTGFDADTGELIIPKDVDGDVSANADAQAILYGLTPTSDAYLRRAFEKDYFTSALPFAQRGAQVLMPLSGVAEANDIDYKVSSDWYNFDGTQTAIGAVDLQNDAGQTRMRDSGGIYTRVENIDGITFDNVTTTINDVRRSFAIQRWLENNARGGARYTEQIQSHFNVQVPDYRLQRAEYLGGGRQPVQISEVLSTAETDTAEVGEMFGHGLSVGSTNQFTYRCEEHGFIIGFISVTMRTAYSQGIPKMFSREEKFDYAFPELANLGEQEIVAKEVFFSFTAGDDAANQGVFGYIPRYAEYKFHNDRIAGNFRGSLSFWHLGRRFTSRPSLDVNMTTIFENGDEWNQPDVASSYEESFRRIFNVTDGTDYLWIQLYHRLTAKRPLPYFGVPSYIG